MKKLPMILVFLNLCLAGFGQDFGSLEGLVCDSTENQNLPYVNIILLDTKIGTFSDTLGRFELNNIPVGEYNIEFSYIGYSKKKLERLRIFKDSTLFIKISLFNCEYDVLGRKNCPICKKSDEVIPIVYGWPSRKTKKQAKKGKLWISVYGMDPCHPHWYCKRDEERF
jgi:hypothetical protein